MQGQQAPEAASLECAGAAEVLPPVGAMQGEGLPVRAGPPEVQPAGPPSEPGGRTPVAPLLASREAAGPASLAPLPAAAARCGLRYRSGQAEARPVRELRNRASRRSRRSAVGKGLRRGSRPRPGRWPRRRPTRRKIFPGEAGTGLAAPVVPCAATARKTTTTRSFFSPAPREGLRKDGRRSARAQRGGRGARLPATARSTQGYRRARC